MIDEIQVDTDGQLGRIRLNRPRAINALSLEMIEAITESLLAWRDDAGIGAILFEGVGEKGFCSGGDVRAARTHVVEGRPEAADHYFATEYRMNGLIASYPKPLIALTHGIVMGGGIGVAGHCGFRVTQPGARYAMPESAIGLFGDVGVNAILAKAPLNRALLFLMSGVSVGTGDAIALGLADATIQPDRADAFRRDLALAASSSHPADAVVRLMQAESIEPGEAPFCAWADMLPATDWDSPASFVAAVHMVHELAEVAALLATRSPTSLTAIFFAQRRARQLMDVDQTLAMDLRLAALMARAPDFAEGVRAVLVDKDQSPRWSPGILAEVDPLPIRAAVQGP